MSVLAESLDFVTLEDLKPAAMANMTACSSPSSGALGRRMLQLGVGLGIGSEGADSALPRVAAERSWGAEPPMREAWEAGGALGGWLEGPGVGFQGLASPSFDDADWMEGGGEDAGTGAVRRARGMAAGSVGSNKVLRRALQQPAAAAAGAPQPPPAAPSSACENSSTIAVQMRLHKDVNESRVNNKARPYEKPS